jgi:hypothetical protein
LGCGDCCCLVGLVVSFNESDVLGLTVDLYGGIDFDGIAHAQDFLVSAAPFSPVRVRILRSQFLLPALLLCPPAARGRKRLAQNHKHTVSFFITRALHI